MSNIYIQEPPTLGKVLLITTVGDIDIELWSKETPKACRNFVQLAMEGYYNGTKFHRVVKGFIAQGGDPTGTGTGGESIYGHPFKDEFHSRLRFCRRGLVAMANAGKDDNGSQFFFTFAACPELQNKHTIFGKVTGETIYNMIKLEEAVVDHNETPLYPQKIIRAEILFNPFEDIIPRTLPEKKEKKKKSEKSQPGIKNFKLLSFGEEAEEDEEKNIEITLSLAGKSKSTHDVLNDPKLSCVTITEQDVHETEASEKTAKSMALNVDDVRKKLKRKQKADKKKSETETVGTVEKEHDFLKSDTEKKKKRLQEIADEVKALKKEYQKNRKQEKEKEVKGEKGIHNDNEKEENELVREYKNNLEKYRHLKGGIPKKGADREAMTLQLLANFKERLEVVKSKQSEELKDDGEPITWSKDAEDNESWLVHKLNFEGNNPVLAKDANMKTNDWFDLTDPRNAINKRRREKSEMNAKNHICN